MLATGRGRPLANAAVIMAALVLLLVIGAPRAFYPSLHCDESLYTGAALHMLDGDFFLTHFWLDKTFLGPLFIDLGVLVGGRGALGFHLAGWCAGITAVLMLMRTQGELVWRANAVQRSPFLASLLMMLLQLAAFVLPVGQFYLASAFFEPFTLLCVAVMLKHLVLGASGVDARRHLHMVYWAFAVGVCCKFTVVLWAPALAGLWLLEAHGRWYERLWHGCFDLLRTTAPIWLVTGYFMLTNSEKLAPISWFKHLYAKTNEAAPPARGVLWQHLLSWLKVTSHLLGGPWVFVCLILLLLTATVLVLRRAWTERMAPNKAGGAAAARWQLMVVIGPFWLHALAIWLAGSLILDRYLFLLIPQGIAVLSIGAMQVGEIASARKLVGRLYHAGVVALLLAAGWFAWSAYPYHMSYEHQVFYPPAFGRALHQILEEVPDGAVIHQQDKLWFLFPYVRNGQIRTACQSDLCVQEAGYGHRPFDRQFLFYDPPGVPSAAAPARLYQAFPTDLFSAGGTTYVTTTALDERMFRSALRLGGWAQSVELSPGQDLVTNLPPPPSLDPALHVTWRALPSALLELQVVRKALPAVLDSWVPKRLHLSGRVVMRPPLRLGEAWWLGFRAESLVADGWSGNLVDIAPLLWKGYFVPLKPLDVPVSGAGQFPQDLTWIGGAGAPQVVASVWSAR